MYGPKWGGIFYNKYYRFENEDGTADADGDADAFPCSVGCE
jgi:hypothetical protein